MAFCPNCGTPVQGQFCERCGTPVTAGSAGPQAGPPPAQGSAGGLTENVAGALAYLLGFITGILFLVLAPYNQNRFVRFHAFQSIFVHVAFIVIWIAVGAILPWQLSLVLSPVIGLGGLGVWLFLMWKAYQNERFKVPVIGDLAEKQA